MEVIVKRSSRRKKTIQARMDGDALLVMAPADISDELLEKHVAKLKLKVQNKIKTQLAPKNDGHLEKRAIYLNQKYFKGALIWDKVSYSDRQIKRYGSCTPEDKTIRISTKMEKMPQWVEDYVIFHELAHLLVPNHGRKFKELVGRYSLAERAKGFLMGVEMMERSRV